MLRTARRACSSGLLCGLSDGVTKSQVPGLSIHLIPGSRFEDQQVSRFALAGSYVEASQNAIPHVRKLVKHLRSTKERKKPANDLLLISLSKPL